MPTIDESLSSLRALGQQAGILLPGAIALLAFQVVGIARGPSRLETWQLVALCLGALWTSVAVGMFAVSLRRAASATTAGDAKVLLYVIPARVAGATVTLLFGALTDILVGLVVFTGSIVAGAIVAGVLVALVLWTFL